MLWKIISFVLVTTLVGVIWGTFVYPKLPISSVGASPSLQSTEVGRSRIGVAPRIISYQGYLKDSSNGQPVSNANRTAVFSLYTSDSGGSKVWQETKTIVTRNGVFRTILGQTYPINPSIVAVPELWLGVRLPPDAEMTPRQRIAGSVYSVGATEAQVADTAGVTARQIALRKWYKADLGRGPRVDVEMLAVSGGIISSPDTSAFKSLDVTAMTTRDIGSVFFNWGTWLSKPEWINTTTNGGGFASTSEFNYSCNALMAVNQYYICLTSSQFALIPTRYLAPISGDAQIVDCADCRGMAYDGLNVWVSSSSNNQVYKIDLTREYSEHLTSPCFTQVSTSTATQVCHANPKPPTITATIDVGNNPQGVAFDGERVWVANKDSDTVTVIDAGDASVIATVSVGSAPTEVLFDGQSIWVLNSADETVTQVDASTRSVIGTYGVGASPKALSFDGSAIWVANSGDDNVTLLRHTDGSLVETISLSGSPQLLQFDGEGTWVALKENPPSMKQKNTLISGERWVLTRY